MYPWSSSVQELSSYAPWLYLMPGRWEKSPSQGACWKKNRTGPSKSTRAQEATANTDKSDVKNVGRLRPVKSSSKSPSFPSPFMMANGRFRSLAVLTMVVKNRSFRQSWPSPLSGVKFGNWHLLTQFPFKLPSRKGKMSRSFLFQSCSPSLALFAIWPRAGPDQCDFFSRRR